MEKGKGLREAGNEGGGAEMGEQRRKEIGGKSDGIVGSGDLGIGGEEWFDGGMNVGDEIARLFGEGGGGGSGLGGGGVSFWGGGGGEVGGGQAFGLEEIQGGFGEKFQFGGGLGDLDGGEGIHLWGNEGLGGEGMQGLFDRSGQFWGGEASGNVDNQGAEGCLSVNVSGNGGQIGESRAGSGEDRSGGGGQGSKGKRGRPKGSKNKKKIIEAEEGVVGLSETASVKLGADGSGGNAEGLKDKRGRPKGSKKKKKITGDEEGVVGGLSEIASVNVGGEEIATPKRKVGRPKGSKNKKKALANDGNGGVPDGGEESKVLVGNESVTPKSKLGRPKGSKNKKKALANDQNGGEESKGSVGNESVGPKRKVSQPKGPKTKRIRTAVKDDVMSRDLGYVAGSVPSQLTGSEKEMLHVEQSGKMETIESSGREVGNNVLQLKKRRGRPRKVTPGIDGTNAMSNETSGRTCTGGPIVFFMGLEDECPDFGSKEDNQLPDVQPKVNLVETGNEYVLGNTDGSDRTVLVTGLENEMPVLTGVKDKEMYKKEAVNGKEGGCTVQQNGKRGRPKSSAKKKFFSSDEIRGKAGEIMCGIGNERSMLEGKEDGKMTMEASMAIDVGNVGVQVKKKRGRPKGSTRKNDHAVQENQEISSNVLGTNEGATKTVWSTASLNNRTKVAGEQGVRICSETESRNDIQTEDVNSQLKEIQEKFKGMVVDNGGDVNDTPMVSSKNERPIHVGEKEKGMSAACGSIEGGNEAVPLKRPARCSNRRPIASVGEDHTWEGENVRKIDSRDESSKSERGRAKKKRRIIRPEASSKVTVLMHQNYLEEDLSIPTRQLKNSEDTEIKLQKRPRGRPRKISNLPLNHSEFRTQQVKKSEDTVRNLSDGPRGKRPRGRPRRINNQPISHSEFRTQQIKNSEDTEKRLHNKPRGKRPRGRPKMLKNLQISHSDFRARQLKNSLRSEQKFCKRLRGRPRKFNNLQAHPRDYKQGISTDILEKKENLWCHQCLTKARSGVVLCLNCRKKRYCYDCLAKWYPEKTKEDIEIACPYCRANCNCRICLKGDLVVLPGHEETDTNTKLEKLLYLLFKTLPLLKHIQQEQRSELDAESCIRGVQLTEEDLTRSILEDDDRVYWYHLNSP